LSISSGGKQGKNKGPPKTVSTDVMMSLLTGESQNRESEKSSPKPVAVKKEKAGKAKKEKH